MFNFIKVDKIKIIEVKIEEEFAHMKRVYEFHKNTHLMLKIHFFRFHYVIFTSAHIHNFEDIHIYVSL
jgi:hypothetical protein